MAQTQTAEPETRLARIERGIDRDMANNLPISRSSGGTFTIAPQSMGELLEFSKLMAVSDFCVRPAFRGNPGACLAVALQAFRCGGDPFAWCNKAYITKNKAGEEQVSYEAQLIHAIVIASGVLQRRLRPVYEGEGTKRKCRIVGFIKGENEAFEYESPRIEEIAVRNSPLWTADRDQQLFYYSTRAWARRHVPEILLGIYAPEEMGEIVDMTPEPEPQRGDYIDHAAAQREPEPEIFAVVALDGELFEFERADNAIDALRTVLTGARRAGRKMLEAAAENNEALIAQLGEAGTELLAEFSSPAPSDTRSETPAPVDDPAQSPGRAASSEPPGTPPARESTPAPSQPSEPAEPPTAPPAAAAAPAADLAPGQRLGLAEARPPTPAAAPPATSPENGAASPAPTAEDRAPSPAGPGPTAPTAASPTDERKSLAIDMPLSRGKPDYRIFTRGLLIPKIRQQTNGDDLAWLLGDNADNIERARSMLERQDIAELDEVIDVAWTRLRP